MKPELDRPIEVRRPARSRYTPQRYKCKLGHESEFIVEDRERLNTHKCKTCGKKAEHVRVVNAINALPKSTIVYEKLVDGKMRRMYVDPQAPQSLAYAEKKGFQKREIQGMHAMREFEREVTRDMKQEFNERQRADHKRHHEFNEAYTSDLRSLIARSDLDPFTREILREAAADTEHGFQYREPDFEFHNSAFGE